MFAPHSPSLIVVPSTYKHTGSWPFTLHKRPPFAVNGLPHEGLGLVAVRVEAVFPPSIDPVPYIFRPHSPLSFVFLISSVDCTVAFVDCFPAA